MANSTLECLTLSLSLSKIELNLALEDFTVKRTKFYIGVTCIGLAALAQRNANNAIWGHYSAVEARTARAGSREYWVSCSTHEILFEAPTSYKQIIDRGEPLEFFSSSDCRYIAPLGSVPELISSNTQVRYGIYPQTVLEDSDGIYTTLNALSPETNGYYLYNGDYYAKVIANPKKNTYSFDNGVTIVSGATYWFKCEPITWNVLSNSNGQYFMLSSFLLDAHCYYNSLANRTIDDQTIYPNNYKYSDIRTWLNADFYNSAFPIGNAYIQTTLVDNSASTTNSNTNAYVCDNTQDKVFLPSYQDYLNSDYGFSTSTSSTSDRYCKTTDWTRARNATYSTDSPSYYNSYYWTRSPAVTNYYAWTVGTTGFIYYNDRVNYTSFCVRPAINIAISL